MIVQMPNNNILKNLVKFVMNDIYNDGDWKIITVEDEKVIVEKISVITVNKNTTIVTREITTLGLYYIDYTVKGDDPSYDTNVKLIFSDYDQMAKEMGMEFVFRFRNLLERKEITGYLEDFIDGYENDWTPNN